VWGTPVAQEDDAERAVRAALDLLMAVSALGADVGAPELRARAGVLTGEAAVTLGAEGQGMVAGDLVNTASRIQSTAESGSVLVGEATKRAAEAAIVFEDAGSHTLKGKAEPVSGRRFGWSGYAAALRSRRGSSRRSSAVTASSG
jgi:class 3 adenylate cyclase